MNILVLRLSSLGDIVLLAPVLASIKSRFPSSHLACLVKPAYAGLIGAHAAVDEVIVYENFLQARRRLSALSWDVVLDLHAVWKTRLLGFLIPARRKIIYCKEAFSRRLLVMFKRKPSSFRHTIQKYMQALGQWMPFSPMHTSRLEWRFLLRPPSRAQTEKIERWLAPASESAYRIGLAPGAKWATKRWPVLKYAALAKHLAKQHTRAVFVILGGREDQGVCQALYESLAGCETVPLAGQVDLADLPYLMQRLKLFIGNDSGLMHLASGLGVPAVGIFGPTVREFGFAPINASSRMVEADLRCRPCSLHGGSQCPRGHFLCMELISMEDAAQACSEALAHA